jgi:hypothetical protein
VTAIARYHDRGVGALQIARDVIAIPKERAAETDDDLNEQERPAMTR